MAPCSACRTFGEQACATREREREKERESERGREEREPAARTLRLCAGKTGRGERQAWHQFTGRHGGRRISPLFFFFFFTHRRAGGRVDLTNTVSGVLCRSLQPSISHPQPFSPSTCCYLPVSLPSYQPPFPGEDSDDEDEKPRRECGG